MSVRVLSWVLNDSPVSHRGDLLVLIVLADHAHDDGAGAYPSVERIAEKARLTRRGAQLALRRLELAGAIMAIGRGPKGTVEYRVVMDYGGELASLPGGELSSRGGEVHALGGRSESHEGANSPSPEPSLTVQEPSCDVRSEQPSHREETEAARIELRGIKLRDGTPALLSGSDFHQRTIDEHIARWADGHVPDLDAMTAIEVVRALWLRRQPATATAIRDAAAERDMPESVRIGRALRRVDAVDDQLARAEQARAARRAREEAA